MGVRVQRPAVGRMALHRMKKVEVDTLHGFRPD
jgi:hypothetical protein